MSDYISREALIGKAEKHYCDPCKGQGGDLGGDWCRSCVINSVLEKVRGIPAADVEPVRHGRWEPGNPICPVCGEDKFKGLDADIWSDWTPACCPNCGAKMQGAENE